MTRLLPATCLLVVLAATSACGGSSGPAGVLDVATQAGVVSACANLHNAAADHQAGDDASADTALQAAVIALRKPPADPAAAPIATTISSRLGAGDVAGAVSAGTSFCAGRGE